MRPKDPQWKGKLGAPESLRNLWNVWWWNACQIFSDLLICGLKLGLPKAINILKLSSCRGFHHFESSPGQAAGSRKESCKAEKVSMSCGGKLEKVFSVFHELGWMEAEETITFLSAASEKKATCCNNGITSGPCKIFVDLLLETFKEMQRKWWRV